MTRLYGLVGLIAVAATTSPGRADSGIVSASVIGVSKMEPVAAIDVGRRQGIAMRDRVAIVDAADATRVVGAGEVFIVDETRAVVRLTEPPASGRGPQSRPSDGSAPVWRAVVVPSSFVTRAKGAMPAGTTISARAASVAPGRRQLWIDLGGLSGLAEHDTVWIRREDFPIARGHVVLVLEGTALVQPRPLVSNAVPDVGDVVELWPSPAARRTGRPESVVMEVTPDEEGAVLTLAGARRDGLTPDRQLDLFDGDAYVGLAGVTTSSDRLCLAKSLRAFCATQPSVGLRAVGRPGAARPSARLEARIFDVREGYVLISAGGADGVQAAQTFAVLRDGKIVARLEVRKVEFDFAGAEPLPPERGETPAELKKWDLVVREPVPPDAARTIGRVDAVWRAGSWLTGAITAADARAEPGAVLRLAADTPVAAIVAGVTDAAGIAGPRMLLYIPPGWGRATIFPGQRIERVSD
jgi:hypothetical protein